MTQAHLNGPTTFLFLFPFPFLRPDLGESGVYPTSVPVLYRHDRGTSPKIGDPHNIDGL